MFENRVRKRRRNTLLLIITLLLVSAFGFGYYLNYGGNTNVNKGNTGEANNPGYQIPNSIRNPGIVNADANPQQDTEKDPADEPEQSTTAIPNTLITPTTKIIFKTYFTLCSHMVDHEPEDTKEFINLSEAALKNKYTDWTVTEFSSQQVILKREISTYCPRHFIISSKDGYIAIYVYNNDGLKTLYEVTDNPISILTQSDQKNLEYGIVADSEEELQQKLEGLGD